MNIRLPFISLIGKSAGQFFKKHYRLMLFIFFLVVIALWGFIFWQYVYQVALYDPHVVVKPLPIKQKELKTIIDDLNIRAEIQSSVKSKTFPEPFIEPPKEVK